MKKIFFLLLVCCVAFATGSAQPMNISSPEQNQRAAEEAEKSNNPYAALEFYEDAYDQTKDKTLLPRIAKLYFEIRDYAGAEKKLSRLVLKDRRREHTELRFWYAMCLKYNEKYADAIEQFQLYQTDGQDPKLVERCKLEIAGCEAGRKAKQPELLLVNNAGKGINSPQTEASPSYSGGELYFTSLKSKEIITLNGKEGDWWPKVYSASRTANEFGDPAPLGTQINREDWAHGNVSISPDGKTMYFTRVEMQNNGMSTSQIFVSKKGSDGWGAANEAKGVNGDFIAKHPCEGELFGEKVLFFVANMPGGKGGDDIYYAPKKSDTEFGLPVNLGDVINTAGDEVSPFYMDGKLYFSTNGRPTIGGLDVFESQWNGSVWSAPKALDKGINSSVDDFFYSRSADGMSGFLVSNRPGPNNLKSKTCCDDIYIWEIERVKVNLMAKTFRLKRQKEKENQPLENCTVSIFDVTEKTPKPVEEKTNAKLNDFEFTLQPERSYLIVATRDEYRPDTLKFNTLGVKKTLTVDKKLTLRRAKKEEPAEDSIVVKINEPIRLNNIYYDFDDDKILNDAEDDLQYLVDLMNRYPDLKIELSSHTDAQGKDDYNEKLSQRRAESARNWMISKGIAGDRITPVGYGERQILNGCTNGVKCDDEQHRFNRRTEFKIIAGPTSITIEKKEKKAALPKDNQAKPDSNKPKTGGKQAFRDYGFFLN
ncbi:MAG: OmpA family protein [Saprospiraceae bacterium]